MQIEALRQTQATLSIEQMELDKDGLDDKEGFVRGEMTREGYQNAIKEKHQIHAKN